MSFKIPTFQVVPRVNYSSRSWKCAAAARRGQFLGEELRVFQRRLFLVSQVRVICHYCQLQVLQIRSFAGPLVDSCTWRSRSATAKATFWANSAILSGRLRRCSFTTVVTVSRSRERSIWHLKSRFANSFCDCNKNVDGFSKPEVC